MSGPMIVREALPEDAAAVLDVHRAAFGGEEEAGLVEALLGDPTAQPVVSLLAEDGGRVVGHVLLTTATLEGPESGSLRVMLLAPLAVAPDRQGRGVGGALVRASLERARCAGAGLVFVLGHPGYYGRFGFAPAGWEGLEAPYPVPDADADAWMVRELDEGLLAGARGRLRAADALMRPELWRE